MKFEEKDKKFLKGLSKAMYIIAKIMKVVSIIGAAFCAIFSIILFIIMPNIKIDNNTKVINFYKNDYYYEISDEIKLNGKIIASNIDDYQARQINQALDNSTNYILGFTSIVFVDAAVLLFIACRLFSYTEYLFRNIYEKKTPFIKDNVNYIFKIGVYLAVSFLLTDISGFIISIIYKVNTKIEVNLFNYVYVLLVFIMYYIFKYGYSKEKK